VTLLLFVTELKLERSSLIGEFGPIVETEPTLPVLVVGVLLLIATEVVVVLLFVASPLVALPPVVLPETVALPLEAF
jgi:hypothetical protein